MGGLGVWKNPIKLVTGHMAIRVCLNVGELRRIPVEPAQVLYGVLAKRREIILRACPQDNDQAKERSDSHPRTFPSFAYKR